MVKRVVALVATAVMMVGMIIPTTAAPGPQGSITVHKYAGNRASEIENHTGEKLTAAEVESKITNAGYKPLAGAEFTLYQAVAADVEALTTAMQGNDGIRVTGSSIDTSGTNPVITFTTTHYGTEFKVNTTPYVGGAKTTNASGEATFGNGDIPNGYYVLVETDTPEDYEAAAPSLIQLPLANAHGEQHYDIHVYPKNVSTTNLVKKDMADVATLVENGDTLSFDLKLKFKNAEEDAKFKVNSADDLTDGTNYGTARIIDILSDALEYVPNSLEVYWLNKTTGELDTSRTISSTSYEMSITGQEIKVDLNNTGLGLAKTGSELGFGIALKAQYLGFPVAGQVDQRISNKMIGLVRPYTWNEEDPEDPSNPEPPIVVDEVFAPALSIKVNKRDGESKDILPGVTFALAKTATPVHYDPRLSYSPGDLDDYVLGADEKPITGVTNADGSVFFSRLEGYSDLEGAKFYLKEIETKDGYQLKINTIEVKFDNKAYYQSNKPGWFNGNNWKQNVEVQVIANVDNYRTDGPQDPDELGFSLPLTGGAGTIMFTIIGATVMLGAAMLIIKRKKKEA